MKRDRHGKAAILSDIEYSRIRKKIAPKKYKILLDLAWFTGERWGALVQLKVSDVYASRGIIYNEITFKSHTRKASPDGTKNTRQVLVHSTLREYLENYEPSPSSQFLFPNRNNNNHITLRYADKLLRNAVNKAGLSSKGISTHSTRRSFITKLHRNGYDLYTIQKITGHKDLKSLARYVDIEIDQLKTAIESL